MSAVGYKLSERRIGGLRLTNLIRDIRVMCACENVTLLARSVQLAEVPTEQQQ
jgi:hypothetical protein